MVLTQERTLEGQKSVFASPNQKYWDLGLKSFNEGDSATTAIQTIWEAMQPPASLPLLATIVGALWADSYWAQTKLDTNLLAANLQAALGLNYPDCLKAATFAFQTWYGLLVRANFGDQSSIPKSDPVTASPDVVVNGAATLTVKQLITMWNQYVYTPQPGLKNNTYGRAQSANLQVPITKPVLRMYYSDAGFNPPPSTWVKMFTFDGSETSPLEGITSGTTLGVGERAANPNSFAFNPPGAGHYCLITVVGTEYFTNNPSANQGGNWNTQEWIHYNGAAGWHNVDVPKENKATLKYYNQDGVPERFIFEAHCCNLPEGTIVSLESGHKELAHPIKSAILNISRPYQVLSTEAEIPPNFAGELKIQFKTPDGKPLPEKASIDVRMDWHLASTHRNYTQAIEQLKDIQALAQQRSVRIGMGNFVFVGGKGTKG
jgi:hypothetical protein